MATKDQITERARAQVQSRLELEERNRQVKILRERMNVARAGVMFYQNRNFKEALDNYYKYLGILEKWKNVKSGELEPKLFDSKSDVAELLLISGIYWDIAKLQDRAKKKDKVQLKIWLDKFVLFSKGMTYQSMCAELIRKYLMNERAIHKSLFKEAHMKLSDGKCFIATSVEEYCSTNTVMDLRRYRDEVLLKNLWGKLFVKIYYCVGPYLASWVLKTPESFQKRVAAMIDKIARAV